MQSFTSIKPEFHDSLGEGCLPRSCFSVTRTAQNCVACGISICKLVVEYHIYGITLPTSPNISQHSLSWFYWRWAEPKAVQYFHRFDALRAHDQSHPFDSFKLAVKLWNLTWTPLLWYVYTSNKYAATYRKNRCPHSASRDWMEK